MYAVTGTVESLWFGQKQDSPVPRVNAGCSDSCSDLLNPRACERFTSQPSLTKPFISAAEQQLSRNKEESPRLRLFVSGKGQEPCDLSIQTFLFIVLYFYWSSSQTVESSVRFRFRSRFCLVFMSRTVKRLPFFPFSSPPLLHLCLLSPFPSLLTSSPLLSLPSSSSLPCFRLLSFPFVFCISVFSSLLLLLPHAFSFSPPHLLSP